jgi:hypothetical protein
MVFVGLSACFQWCIVPIKITIIIKSKLSGKRDIPDSKGDIQMKTISILLGMLNSLAAGLVITASVTRVETIRQAASFWLLTKVISSLGVIAAGILIWISAKHITSPKFVVLSSLFLVTLGTASAVWALHLALVSGNMRGDMFLYSSSLMTQGAASIWNLLIDAGNNTAI